MMDVTILLSHVILATLIRILDAQTCAVYTAGSTNDNEHNPNTNAAIYVNRRSQEEAKCSGTVYAWNYCYYPENSETNLQVAFGVFSFTNIYTLRDGSYHLLHLDMREDTFTCDTLTLEPSEYFQIQGGDRVGACLRDTDYLDILRDHSQRRVDSWTGGGSCTEADMGISPTIRDSNRRRAQLHLYVDINIDECAVGEHNCHRDATCSDIVGADGSFQCYCNTGYSGDGVNCINIDECATDMDNCAEQATCTDNEGSFTCTCNNGYTGNGTRCDDIDECATDMDNCAEQATCTDNEGSFTCTCNNGYTGNGIRCDDIDECATAMDNCAEHATCTDIEGSYSCNCNTGYTGDGTECIDVNECELKVDSCDENANCTNIDGGHNCFCLPGYSGNGTYCYDIDECTTDMDNCAEKARCTNTDGSFSCTCDDGYTGYGVECYDINECEKNSDSCDVNADCINTNGSFSCSCKHGYSGNGATCTDIDECLETESMCGMNSKCTNTEGSYMCTCSDGFTGNGSHCSDMDECLGEVSNDCSAVADCINTVGSYSCQCKPGYGGDGTNCSDVDECSGRSHDCSKNAECLNIEGGYNCQCPIGYTGNGKVCEALPDVRETEEQKNGDSGSNLGLISGVTVTGLLVVATLLIIGFLCALKLRKRSKSVHFASSVGFENKIYGVGKRGIMMSTISFNGDSSAKAQHRDLDNPIYDGILPQDEQESELTMRNAGNCGIYDTPQDMEHSYDIQCPVDSNVYDDPTLLQGLHSPTANYGPLECYSAVDYYSTLDEYSSLEQEYGNIVRKVTYPTMYFTSVSI
jgi:hypothetical protein